MGKKTLVLGASEKTDRYANIAMRRLIDAGHPVVAVGNKVGAAHGVKIQTEFPLPTANIDTVTLYLSAKYQEDYKAQIIHLKPKRVIFNPGTENQLFEQELAQNGIATEEACTLVLLSMNQY